MFPIIVIPPPTLSGHPQFHRRVAAGLYFCGPNSRRGNEAKPLNRWIWLMSMPYIPGIAEVGTPVIKKTHRSEERYARVEIALNAEAVEAQQPTEDLLA